MNKLKVTRNNEIITIVIVVAVLLALFGWFGIVNTSSYGMMGGFRFMWIFGWLFMMLVIVALVLFIIWLVNQLQNPKGKR